MNTNTENFANDLEERDNQIYETMTREDFENYFRENREINYKGTIVGIMNWETGGFDVLTPANNEDGFEILNTQRYSALCDAIKFTVDYLVRNEESITNGTISSKNKKKTKVSRKAKVETEPKYDGPRIVKVFGREIYIEENTEATFEDIRANLVANYGMYNFKPEKTLFDFDSSTGTLEVGLKFQVKG